MAIRTKKIPLDGLPNHAVATWVESGAIAKADRIMRVSDTQDGVGSHGRRILANAGIRGAANFLVNQNDNPNYQPVQTYPEPTRICEIGQWYARLMPGMRLRVDLLAIPSGPCQLSFAEPYSAWMEQGRLGVLGVTVRYEWSGGSSERSVDVSVPGSTETYGAEPEAFAAGGLRYYFAVIPHPADMEDNPEYCGEVKVRIALESKASLRLVDCVVSEEPYEYWRDDTHREGPIHNPGTKYPSEYAITGRALPSDARCGARQHLKTVWDQRQYWGPALWQWSSWDESNADITYTEPRAVTTSSTSLVNLIHQSLTSYSAGNPGWSMSSGGTARCAEWSGILELRERAGVVPVTVRVYGYVSGGTGTVRVQSGSQSLVELTITNTSADWIEGLAWLECGIHQNVFSNLQVLGKISSAIRELSVLYMSIDYGGHMQLHE